MKDNLEKTIQSFSQIKEKCIDGKDHNYNYFSFENEISDDELICVCGSFIVYKEAVNKFGGLLHYVDSERFKTLRSHYSAEA